MLGSCFVSMRRLLEKTHTQIHRIIKTNVVILFCDSVGKAFTLICSVCFMRKMCHPWKHHRPIVAMHIRCSRVARRIQCHRIELIAGLSSSCLVPVESSVSVNHCINAKWKYVWMKICRSCQRPISDPKVKWMRWWRRYRIVRHGCLMHSTAPHRI